MFICRLTPELTDAGVLQKARGAWAQPSTPGARDIRSPRYFATDAHTGQRLDLGTPQPQLGALEIGDKVSLNGNLYELAGGRVIAHQGPVFILSKDEAARWARKSRLLLHDALNGRDHIVSLTRGTLSSLTAGNNVLVDGRKHMVSGFMDDRDGRIIFTVPHGPALCDWEFRSMTLLKLAPHHRSVPEGLEAA